MKNVFMCLLVDTRLESTTTSIAQVCFLCWQLCKIFFMWASEIMYGLLLGWVCHVMQGL